MIKRTLCFATVLYSITSTASAGSFSSGEANIFANCLPQMNTLAQEMQAKGEAKEVFDGSGEMVVDGKFAVYSGSLSTLKSQYPGAYERVDDAAEDCGLDGVDHFARVGDGVMGAYMAKRIPPGTIAMMQSMAPEMLDRLPPQARKGLSMMAAVQNVPEEDKVALTEEVMAIMDANIQKMAPGIDPKMFSGQ